MKNNSKQTKGKSTRVQVVFSKPRKRGAKPINTVIHKKIKY